jgi:hypothetical protein
MYQLRGRENTRDSVRAADLGEGGGERGWETTRDNDTYGTKATR